MRNGIVINNKRRKFWDKKCHAYKKKKEGKKEGKKVKETELKQQICLINKNNNNNNNNHHHHLEICNSKIINQTKMKEKVRKKHLRRTRNILQLNSNPWNLLWFYGISTIVGYLMPNPLYTYILNIYDLVWLGFMVYQPL